MGPRTLIIVFNCYGLSHILPSTRPSLLRVSCLVIEVKVAGWHWFQFDFTATEGPSPVRWPRGAFRFGQRNALTLSTIRFHSIRLLRLALAPYFDDSLAARLIAPAPSNPERALTLTLDGPTRTGRCSVNKVTCEVGTRGEIGSTGPTGAYVGKVSPVVKPSVVNASYYKEGFPLIDTRRIKPFAWCPIPSSRTNRLHRYRDQPWLGSCGNRQGYRRRRLIRNQSSQSIAFRPRATFLALIIDPRGLPCICRENMADGCHDGCCRPAKVNRSDSHFYRHAEGVLFYNANAVCDYHRTIDHHLLFDVLDLLLDARIQKSRLPTSFASVLDDEDHGDRENDQVSPATRSPKWCGYQRFSFWGG